MFLHFIHSFLASYYYTYFEVLKIYTSYWKNKSAFFLFQQKVVPLENQFTPNITYKVIMQDTNIHTGVYVQIINRLFKLKLNEVDAGRFYIGKKLISKDDAVNILSKYLQ